MGSPKLTEAQVDDLRHALGLTRSKVAYRNYYCAEKDRPRDAVHDNCDAGMMRVSHSINGGRDLIYVVTDTGRAYLATLDRDKDDG